MSKIIWQISSLLCTIFQNCHICFKKTISLPYQKVKHFFMPSECPFQMAMINDIRENDKIHGITRMWFHFTVIDISVDLWSLLVLQSIALFLPFCSESFFLKDHPMVFLKILHIRLLVGSWMQLHWVYQIHGIIKYYMACWDF